MTETRQARRPSKIPAIRRRRICSACKHRWSTYEVAESVVLRAEAFDALSKTFADINLTEGSEE